MAQSREWKTCPEAPTGSVRRERTRQATAQRRAQRRRPSLKILCVADHKDPLVYSPQLKTRFGDVAVVVSAGDLPFDYYDFVLSTLNKPLFFVFGNHNLMHLPQFRRGASSDAARAAAGGRSNSELETILGGTYIGDRVHVERFKDGSRLIIAGLGGCTRYNNGQNQFAERGMTWRILRITPRLCYNRLRYGRHLDILVTHAPPRGIGDRVNLPHQGFRAFLRFMLRFRPRYLVHGHVHLYDRNERREYRYAATTVVNAYDHYVMDLYAPQLQFSGSAGSFPQTESPARNRAP